MSVTEVVEQLRQAHALLTVAREATIVAEAAISEGREIFDHATTGSVWPQVPEIRRLGQEAGDDVRLAHNAMIQAQQIIDDYCHTIAGHSAAGPETTPGTTTGPTARPAETAPSSTVDMTSKESDATDHRTHYAEWIGERERAGVVIRPKNVTRMTRMPNGRIVWIEEKNPDGGQDHILDDDRIDEFRRMGVPEEDIMDLVFTALDRGTVVGYSGKDRPVYEVVFKGERRRVAITVMWTGIIIGAHPISRKRKLRTRLHRS
ncbi:MULTISPECIES: hypothetical protein [Actinoalloteichus]|uniref:DUF4258 domain-containing protein n=1 Tax=Actinoalloteichus fjordicus TaxID=1612552 RepID=A0AAC9PT53_9PSEU|nr:MULTISPECIES: hypothetical protein [Actinoalloteichus]APU15725.1 hypothetical protein UA74_18485 [Actinoalloteichus fjordicus]APU21785.1 hypothetical protein UA75_18975 [Actinoalloteichus sp. GBA129-24]